MEKSTKPSGRKSSGAAASLPYHHLFNLGYPGDSEIGHNIEVLKQTMRDAKRLKKELASQIRALDDKFKRIKEGTRKSKKTRT